MARPFGTKYIESPEKMWELFEEYRTLTKQSPRYRTQFVGRDGVMVKEPLERPLTLEGFECHVFEKHEVLGIDQYFSNQNGAYEDYLGVCSRIRKVIRKDQIEGGMVGQYNPSITQRLNGLKENVEESGSKELTIKVKYEQRDNNIAE
jgi:hypothetical protein